MKIQHTHLSDEVVISIEDMTDQVYTRYHINGVTVLVDTTPWDCPDVMAVHNLIDAAPDLLEELEQAEFVYTQAILRTPTGNLRNKLTDLNILRLTAINKAISE